MEKVGSDMASTSSLAFFMLTVLSGVLYRVSVVRPGCFSIPLSIKAYFKSGTRLGFSSSGYNWKLLKTA